MAKTYNVSRQNAAKLLGVSTRTIDRYVKSGKLSYKKVANKVILAKEEVNALQNDFDALHEQVNTEVVNTSNGSSLNTRQQHNSNLEQNIDEKVDKFFLIFKEKDKVLEEKNKVIFMLQQRVSELEAKIQHMIALPDYNEEKQLAVVEKEKLENKIRQLQGNVKSEKIKNMVYLGLSLIFILIAILFIVKS